MNNQSIRASWKLIEDYPTRDGPYLVAFENSSGEFSVDGIKVWEFSHGEWAPSPSDLSSDEGSFPTYYIDLPMPS